MYIYIYSIIYIYISLSFSKNCCIFQGNPRASVPGATVEDSATASSTCSTEALIGWFGAYPHGLETPRWFPDHTFLTCVSHHCHLFMLKIIMLRAAPVISDRSYFPTICHWSSEYLHYDQSVAVRSNYLAQGTKMTGSCCHHWWDLGLNLANH